MPTVILLDVSLSMAKSCTISNNNPEPLDVLGQNSQAEHNNLKYDPATEDSTRQSTAASAVTQPFSKKDLASHSINTFLDGLGRQAKLEYVALVS